MYTDKQIKELTDLKNRLRSVQEGKASRRASVKHGEYAGKAGKAYRKVEIKTSR